MFRQTPLPMARRSEPPPVPTLGEIRRNTPWLWLNCPACRNYRPIALTPLIIRWRADASSDVLRRSARCARCGHKGALLMRPSWIGSNIGFAPFPVDHAAKTPND
jgi:hypothetical protein